MRRMVGYEWFKTRKMGMCIAYGPTCKPMNYSSVSLYSAISVKYTQQSNTGFYISHLFHIKLFTVHVGYLFFINHPYLKTNEYTVISTLVLIVR